MINKIEVEDLVAVLEEIRISQYPEIPAELVQSIVYAEFEKQDDRPQARKATKKLVDEFLKTVAAI